MQYRVVCEWMGGIVDRQSTAVGEWVVVVQNGRTCKGVTRIAENKRK